MRDTWIDEHTGDETIARPDFRNELRSALAAELDSPASSRRTPWKAIGWASVAAAAAVATVVVMAGNDPSGTVTPATDPTSQPDTSDTLVPFSLRDRLIDVVWIVRTKDGVDLTAELGIDNLPSFSLKNVGRLVGFDGCNEYGFDTSDSGGWQLDGDVVRLDQAIVSTAMACTAVPTPIIPIADGTRVEYAPETGLLTLFAPDGSIYTATGSDVEPPLRDDLVVTADGGTPLDPTVLASVDFPDGAGAPIVALLPDRIVILTRNDSDSVMTFDLDGNEAIVTSIDAVIDENTGGAFGGHDGTLYVVQNSATENSQTVTAYQLTGNVWQVVDSTVVEQNNDGVYNVTGDGLVLGDTIVLAAQTPDPSIPETGWVFGDDGMQVFRNDTDGSTKLWDITEEFENFSIPAATHPFGNGVIFLGNASGEPDQRYIGVLSATEGASEYFRPGTWMFIGADAETALFAEITDGRVTLGVLQAG